MLWPKLPTDRCFRYPLRSLPLSPRPFLLSRLEHRLLCSLPAALAPGVDSQQVLPAGSSRAVLDGSFHQVGGTLFRKVPQEQVASQSCPLALRTERCQWLGPWSVPSGAGLEAAGNTNAVCHQAGRAAPRAWTHDGLPHEKVSSRPPEWCKQNPGGTLAGMPRRGLGFHREVAVAALKKPFPSTRHTPSHSLLALQPRQTELQRHALFVTGSFC